MALTIFFFIKITSKSQVCGDPGLAADAAEHLAVAGHVLNQILDNSVLHNHNTSKIESEKFGFLPPGALCRSTRRGGIIARGRALRKA